MFGSYSFGSAPWGAPLDGNNAQAVLYRTVTEVLHGLGYTPPTGNVSLVRQAVEVLGTDSTILGQNTNIGRIALEVLGAAQYQQRGFALTGVTTTEASIFVVLDPETWTAGGQFHLQGPAESGLTVYGDATTTTIRYSAGSSTAYATLTTPTTKKLVTVVTGSTSAVAQIRVDRLDVVTLHTGSAWAPVTLTDIGRLHSTSRPKSGEIAEIMVFNRSLTGTQRNGVEAYLWCKWFVPGCNPETDLAPACWYDPMGPYLTCVATYYLDFPGNSTPEVDDWFAEGGIVKDGSGNWVNPDGGGYEPSNGYQYSVGFDGTNHKYNSRAAAMAWAVSARIAQLYAGGAPWTPGSITAYVSYDSGDIGTTQPFNITYSGLLAGTPLGGTYNEYLNRLASPCSAGQYYGPGGTCTVDDGVPDLTPARVLELLDGNPPPYSIAAAVPGPFEDGGCVPCSGLG